MHDSLTIANRFLAWAETNGVTLTPMQLLKLVYIAHGWMLGLYGVPLIRDDIQAWRYGPVIPHLYRYIRNFRDQPVGGPIPAPNNDQLVQVEDDLVRQVAEIYGRRSGMDLSRLTHQVGTPWANSYRSGVASIPISNDLIEDHYRGLAQRA